MKKTLLNGPVDGQGEAVYPVTLEEAKLHCCVEHDQDNELIESFIQSATDFAQRRTGRYFLYQRWRFFLDCFPKNEINFTCAPIFDLEGIQYYDVENNLQTLDQNTYEVDLVTEPAAIKPKAAWPKTTNGYNKVLITAGLGYGDQEQAIDNLPASIKIAINLMVADLYRNRADSAARQLHTVPNGVKAHLDQHRLYFL